MRPFSIACIFPILILQKIGRHKVYGEARFNSSAQRQVRRLDTFLDSYSLKYQGCSRVKQWTDDPDSYQKVYYNQMVNFRLCPQGNCDSGCRSGYGDYVIDLDTFVSNYVVDQNLRLSSSCSNVAKECGCDNDDDDCYYQCFIDFKKDVCLAKSGYGNVYPYFSCTQFQGQEENENRNLDEQDEEAEEKEEGGEGEGEQEYYVGPYCADNGYDIYFGVFVDQYCTIPSDTSFYTLTGGGTYLPYTSQSVVTSYECSTCDQQFYYGYDDDGSDGGDICDNLYLSSGKCEAKMSITNRNDKECMFIQAVRSKSPSTKVQRRSNIAAILISFLLVIAIFLCAYIVYLQRCKWDVSRR
mmetsp:Transcript_6842/g.14768  ORF Transcript_6842/g.14768 Transcript_6842/m.14768 type:complete len:354 (-) Transcript_6842:476-1537(-)